MEINERRLYKETKLNHELYQTLKNTEQLKQHLEEEL